MSDGERKAAKRAPAGEDGAKTLRAEAELRERAKAYELLEQRVEERTRELSALLDIAHNVASTLQLSPLLDVILDQLKTVVDYADAGVLVVDGEDLQAVAYRGPLPPEAALLRFPIDPKLPTWPVVTHRETVIIDDVRGDSPGGRAYREAMVGVPEFIYAHVQSFLAVPMTHKERVIGALALQHGEASYYTSHHARLAQAIAQQAAVAIENARLYEQAQELAALEERQRLARELHDSISQALFGIRVGSDTALAQLERDPAKAIESMEYVRALAQGGMAEMRALLFELRPESLETEGLVAGLQKLAAALTARYEIPVETALCEEPAAPLAVKEALYRIAQEALHNTFKHARPTRVSLQLEHLNGDIVLTIQDDGSGFDTGASYPGHLGLHSMKERAARLRGTLEVESAVGAGTRVSARIPS